MEQSLQVLCDAGLDLGLPAADPLSLAQWASEQPGWLGELGNLALEDIPIGYPPRENRDATSTVRCSVGGLFDSGSSVFSSRVHRYWARTLVISASSYGGSVDGQGESCFASKSLIAFRYGRPKSYVRSGAGWVTLFSWSCARRVFRY